MGTTRPDIVEKLMEKHPDATVKDLLLPAALRNGSDALRAPEGTSLVPVQPNQNVTPEEAAAEKVAKVPSGVHHSRRRLPPCGRRLPMTPAALCLQEEMAKSEFPGLWDKDQQKVRKKLYEPNLSVFEQNAMEAARARHKNSMVKPQVVMGKEFKGDAFIPTPKVALFKVGPMKIDEPACHRLQSAVTSRGSAPRLLIHCPGLRCCMDNRTSRLA